MLDAVVIGAGPNGLVAAAELARHGWSVLVLEAKDRPGGALYSEQLTLPGFVHDVCSSVHPLARIAAPLRAMPLERYGLDWIEPPVALAHPLDDGSATWVFADPRLGRQINDWIGLETKNNHRLIEHAPSVESVAFLHHDASPILIYEREPNGAYVERFLSIP